MNEFKPSPEFEEKVREAVSVPSAKPEFVNQLRNELARRPVKMKPRFILRPARAFAFILAAIVLVISVPSVAAAVNQLFGYVPGVGLVENTGNLRMLAEPVSVTREGVTLTITSAFVYADHVELIYDVKGIDPSNDGGQQQNATEDLKAFCGPQSSFDGNYLSDGDAALRLPDGTIVKRMFGSEYPQNAFAMKPVYKTSIPSNVNELTMDLKCIPWARLGAVPENWEVQFKLVAVPEGTVVGEPVLDVSPSHGAGDETTSQLETAQPAFTETVSSKSEVPGATATLEKVVKLNPGYIFYIRMAPAEDRPNLLSIAPVDVYAIDSSGQKIQLILAGADSPYLNKDLWEYHMVINPADGPLTVVVEKAKVYYTSMRWDIPPTKQMIDDQSFTFDAGSTPKLGQTWALDKEFEIGGYKGKVVSARAVSFDPLLNPDFTDAQGYNQGYEFTMQSADPAIQMNVTLSMILRWSPSVQTPDCALNIDGETSSTVTHTILCKGALLNNTVRVTFQDISVLLDDVWQMDWTPPAQ